MPVLLTIFLLACDPDGGGGAANDSADSAGGGGGSDTADTGGDTGSGTDTGDTDTDHTGDTAINDTDDGADDADISGAFNGTAFTMNFADAPNADIRCQGGGFYYFALQDKAGRFQLTVNAASPEEGLTKTWPSLDLNSFQLGAVDTWALDTTYHGQVQSAHITFDAVKTDIRLTGSFEVTWVADSAGNPAANASGTFDLGCR